MDSTIIAAIIGLIGVIFTGFLGIYMYKLGGKSEKTKIVLQKKIEVYSELSGKLQSLQKSLNIFTMLRTNKAMNKFLIKDDLIPDIAIYDSFVSDFYEYYKENCGKIKIFCPNDISIKLEELHNKLSSCRDMYQLLIEGDFAGATKAEYKVEWMKSAYQTDLKLQGEVSNDIQSHINAIITVITNDIN